MLWWRLPTISLGEIGIAAGSAYVALVVGAAHGWAISTPTPKKSSHVPTSCTHSIIHRVFAWSWVPTRSHCE